MQQALSVPPPQIPCVFYHTHLHLINKRCSFSKSLTCEIESTKKWMEQTTNAKFVSTYVALSLSNLFLAYSTFSHPLGIPNTCPQSYKLSTVALDKLLPQ